MNILEGIRVIDWTVFHVGPSTGVKLGEMGAEVIKIEEPGVGELSRGVESLYGVPTEISSGRNWFFEFLNYNKKGMTIDVKTEKGREIMYRLVEKSDVFITNYRHHAVARLGMDYDTLKRYNSRLIYASSSCLGTEGPDGSSPGLEVIAQARSGLMNVPGEEGMPPQMLHSSVCDQTGSLMLTMGVLGALLARERLGIGQEVTTSQLGGAMLLECFNVMCQLLAGKPIPREVRADAKNPLYNYYRCRDERWIVLGMLQDRYWAPFCHALERLDLTEDPRFDTPAHREQYCRELIAILDEAFATRESKEWEGSLREHDLLFGVVNDVQQTLADPQVVANQIITQVEHPVLGQTPWQILPINFSRTPVSFSLPAPELGQHTEEVLTEVCGYTWEEAAQLRDDGII
ncbi:MAG: CoA transferase [Dehalococcoidia bacterium]|nr:CoA transferase [Dehalococcoidia bacterium]